MISVTNRTLVLFDGLARLLIWLLLLGALVWGFVARVINGEGFLGFLVAVLAFFKDRPLFFLDEPPQVRMVTRHPEEH